MNSPLFGVCVLKPHGMDEQPKGTVSIGYVQLEGDGDTLTCGIFKQGEWRDRNGRQFKKPVLGWWHIERASDGTRPF